MLALFDSQIFFSGVLLNETFFVALLLLWAISVESVYRRPTLSRCFLTGALLGLLALLKPASLFYWPVLLFAFLFGPISCSMRQKTRSLVAATAMCGLVILPCTARNLMLFHKPVLISTNG